MKMSIVVSDKYVGIDGIGYFPLSWDGTPSDVHALQWIETQGWIEFVNAYKPNEIIENLPDWAINAQNAWIAANAPKPPKPITSEQNKEIAINLLAQTDWSAIPDVSDSTKSNPYLSNSNEFIAYRNLIRAIAINPPDGSINWPIKPNAIWV